MCWQSETKLYNGSDKDVSASGGKLTKKESLKVKDLKVALLEKLLPREKWSRLQADARICVLVSLLVLFAQFLFTAKKCHSGPVDLDLVLQIPELMSVCPHRPQVQKKNYREEKKRATKELLSTITDPSVIVMADWLKVGTWTRGSKKILYALLK